MINQNTALERETTETLSTRIELISFAIDSLIAKLENHFNKTKELSTEELITALDFILISYNQFLEKLEAGYFNFDPNIRKLKGLLAHDLNKSNAQLENTFGLIKEYAGDLTENDDNNHNVDNSEMVRVPLDNRESILKILNSLTDSAYKALFAVRAGFNIIRAINEAYAKGELTSLSLQNVIEFLGMVPTEDSKVFLLKKTANRAPIEIKFETDLNISERDLTIEQLFSITTLLFNLTGGDTTKGEVRIYKSGDYDVIEICDDMTYHWPKKLVDEYSPEYDIGYLNPGSILKDVRHGLKMVFNLAGQREAQYNVSQDIELIELYNGDEASKSMKGIILKYPHENLKRK